MKKLLFICFFMVLQVAQADISCLSDKGFIVTPQAKAPLNIASVEVNGSDVSVQYSSDIFSLNFANNMEKANDGLFYRVVRGHCTPVTCLSKKTILGYQVFLFEMNGADLYVTEGFVEAPGLRLKKNDIVNAIADGEYDVLSSADIKNCY